MKEKASFKLTIFRKEHQVNKLFNHSYVSKSNLWEGRYLFPIPTPAVTLQEAGTVQQTVSAFPSCWTLVHTADLSSDGGSSI